MIDLAEWYLHQRTHGKLQMEIPEDYIPGSTEMAYQIQRNNIISENRPIVGWKLGGTTQATRNIFDTNELYYGTLIEGMLFEGLHDIELPNLFQIKGEAEVVFRFNHTIENISERITIDKVTQYLESIAAGVEFPDTFIKNIPNYGLSALLADNCAAGVLVTSQFVDILSKNIEKLNSIQILCDHHPIASGSANNIIGGPLSALTDFINLAFEHNLTLAGGQVVATGGCTPCVSIPLDLTIAVIFEEFYPFHFTLKGAFQNDV